MRNALRCFGQLPSTQTKVNARTDSSGAITFDPAGANVAWRSRSAMVISVSPQMVGHSCRRRQWLLFVV